MSLASSLQTHFGFDSFRVGQEDAISSLLNKNHTLVISPLIALMKDQVDALNRKGIPATFINRAIPLPEQQQRLTLLAHWTLLSIINGAGGTVKKGFKKRQSP